MMKNLELRYYVDPAVYERERQSIFRRQWQMVGPVSRLKKPGDYLAVDVAGWKLFALRGQGGVLRGFTMYAATVARVCWRTAPVNARYCDAPITIGCTTNKDP